MHKYLDRLDDIRRIQELIVEQAEHHGVPVVESSRPEAATAQVLELVLASLPSEHAHSGRGVRGATAS